MIRIDRGAEPIELRYARERNLPLAFEAFRQHGPASEAFKATIKDYDVGKPTLFSRQHEKCAYCERHPGLPNQPLEHFRPKLAAWRHFPVDEHGKRDERDTRIVDVGYWWLTWTWENQFFACTTCNGPATKANYFPVKGPAIPPPAVDDAEIPEDSTDLLAEHPYLLDPSRPDINLLDHLQWQPTDHRAPLTMWKWTLYTPSDEGYWTAKILKLGALVNDVNRRFRDSVWPGFAGRVLAHSGNPATAREQWRQLGADLLAPAAPFRAATWWQLDALRCHTNHLKMQLPRLPRP